MMNKLRLHIGSKLQPISHFFIQTLLFSVLALTAPQIFASTTMDKNFDHYNTNFPLDGVHKRTKCDSCHKRGVFKGTPVTCEACHSTNSKIAATTMSSSHVQITGSCDTCHNEKSWDQVRMDHSAVSGSCKSCHGVLKGVTGKPASHTTKLDCDQCHRTRAWLPATGYIHSETDTNCVLCHTPGGQGARYVKGQGHITIIGQDCAECHRNDRPFRPISRKPMPHDGVVSTDCQTCHNGQETRNGADSAASSKKINHSLHVTDLNDCQACHKSGGYRTWNAGTNVPVPGIGSGDHNGKFTQLSCGTAGCHSSPPASHTASIPAASISSSCGDCHASRPARMKHAGNTLATQCKVCHTNGGAGGSMNNKKVTDTTLHSLAVLSPAVSSCDDCHKERDLGGSFKPSNMRAHIGIKASSCQYCHSGATKAIGATSYGSMHSGITGSTNCAACHRSTSDFYRLDTNSVHSPLTIGSTNCNKCHDTGVAYPITGTKKSARHFVSAGVQCDSCHKTTTSFGTVRYTHTGTFPSNHSQYSCRSCHLTGVASDNGRGIGKNLSPDCAGCHAQKFIDNQGDHRIGDTYINHSTCNAGCHGNNPEHSTRNF